jgi:PAS domain S-box-containing protein
MEKITDDSVRMFLHDAQLKNADTLHHTGETQPIQADLERSRDKYYALYDFSPVGYVTLDKEGVILEANLTIAQLLGIDRFRLISRPLALYLEKSYWDVLYFHREKAFDTKKKESSEVLFKKMNGDKFYAQLETIAIKDRNENYTQCLVAIIDISERKVMEDNLKVAFRELQEIFHVSGEGLVAFDSNLNILRMNKVFSETWGIKSDKAIGKHYRDVLKEPLYSTVNRAVNEITHGAGHAETEIEKSGGDGGIAIYGLRAQPYWNSENQLAGIVLALRNVTEQRRIEETVARERKTLELMLESVDEGIITMDRDGYIVHINSVAEKYSGHSRKEAIGSHSGEIISLKKEKSDYLCIRCLQEMANSVSYSHSTPPCGKDIHIISKNGESIPIEPRCAPILDDKHNITGAAMVFRVK